jgi:hypothetical protein
MIYSTAERESTTSNVVVIMTCETTGPGQDGKREGRRKRIVDFMKRSRPAGHDAFRSFVPFTRNGDPIDGAP